MTERECQARLRTRTGQVQAAPQISPQLRREREEILDILTESMMTTSRALKIAVRTLGAIAEEKTLAGVQARNTLEQIGIVVRPVPNLRPTHDHAGPDY